MKTIMKTALGAAMLGGAAIAGTAPASAAVVGVTIGAPGFAIGYDNICYGPIALRPAWCFEPAYYGPTYYSAGWYAPYRVYGGHDVMRERFDRDRFVRDRDDVRDHDHDGRVKIEHRVVR